MIKRKKNPAARETGRARNSSICLAAMNGFEIIRSIHQAQHRSASSPAFAAIGGAP